MCANVCIQEALAHELNRRARTKTNKRACWTVRLICRKGPQKIIEKCCGRRCNTNSCNLSQYQKEMTFWYCDVTSVQFCYLGLPITNFSRAQSSGAVWKSRRPSWAPRPNEPYGLCGRKAILNHASALVTVCPEYIDRHPRTWSSTSSSWGERWARALALESQRGHQMDGWPLHARLCSRPELSQCRPCKSLSD